MKDFNLALNVSGDIQFVLTIREKNLHAAKEEWARITGHLDARWDKRSQTYEGWPVVKTTLPALQRKQFTGYFSY